MVSSKSSETRDRILDAAARLLEEQGPDGASLKDIARAASVSRQAIYLHFENRTGLLVALVQRFDEAEGLPAAVASVMASPTGVAALERAIEVLAEFAPRLHRLASVLDSSRLSDPAMAAAFEDRMESRRRAFRGIFERVAAEGRLRPEWTVEHAADAFWALSTPKSYSDLVVDRGWTLEEYTEYLRRVTFSTFVSDD